MAPVFGYGLTVLDIMPRCYLFLPIWLFSIVSCVVLAKKYGAAKSYPREEKQERLFQALVVEYQAAEESKLHGKDTSLLSRQIMAVWIFFGLALPCVPAWIALFHSRKIYDDYANLERFHNIRIGCTIIYFGFSCWGLNARQGISKRPYANGSGFGVRSGGTTFRCAPRFR